MAPRRCRSSTWVTVTIPGVAEHHGAVDVEADEEAARSVHARQSRSMRRSGRPGRHTSTRRRSPASVSRSAPPRRARPGTADQPGRPPGRPRGPPDPPPCFSRPLRRVLRRVDGRPVQGEPGSRIRSAPFRASGIEPNVSSPSANSTSMPEIRGDPSARSVARVLCLRRRTAPDPGANSGSSRSTSIHVAMGTR